MDEQKYFPALLEFFRALADENRLKIIGLLAQKPTSVTDLSNSLGLSISTTSNHLAGLSRAGLVKAQPAGHYLTYSVQTEKLKEMAKQLLQEENLPKLSEGHGEDAFEQKVLRTFLDQDGRIKNFPAQEKKFIVILKHTLKSFETGIKYSEKEVNEILLRFNEDTASLRRGFIEYKMMAREGGGGSYWRIDQEYRRPIWSTWTNPHCW